VTIFKAYDVRGIYGTEVTEDKVRRIGMAFGSWAKGGKVCTGRDTRVSGPSLQGELVKGILSTGCEVQSYGIVPIAILSFITWKDGLFAAAYISASHNPPEYNGVRFRTGDGYGLLYRQTDIMRFHREGNFLTGQGTIVENDAKEAVLSYADYVKGKLRFKRRLKAVLDVGNGSASVVVPLYQKLGFNPIVLNAEMDGRFPGRGPAPSEETLKATSRAVVENGADYGMGFDPDADRGIVIDDLGRVIPPEKVAIILARRRYHPGDLVIAGFDCSRILEDFLIPEGFNVRREMVGDVFVANTVKDSGAVLGVERSGHFFLPEFQYSDDPFAMSLALGEIISEGQRLSELADQIPDYPYVQKSVKIEGSQETVARAMKTLSRDLASLNPDTTDGLKVMTSDYSVLIRPSNTEPLIRLYVETTGGDPKGEAQKFETMIRDAVMP
jgi:phosphomannomutase / phosphoglucomutase